VVNYVRALLGRFPRLKSFLKKLRGRIGGTSVSSHYEALQTDKVDAESARLRNAWQSDSLPLKQRMLVDQQLNRFRDGVAVDVFDVLVEALRSIPEVAQLRSILEIGCSSGFYSEVMDIAGFQFSYHGCDYSPAFISMSRDRYPQLRFDVADACSLNYANSEFDIVISGCCLLHIPEYEAAIAETARVAGRYAIFHRTPVLLEQPTRHFKKQAYGVETVEIHFNEAEFVSLLTKHGFKLLNTITLSEDMVNGERSAGRTYVCEKL